ncbi:MAG TPA: glycosyl hydrolase family 28-related protein [Verrucomicrobiota bacterium]|nr:glycosyl hydrolase family 28-related protein [Verrucomicrobiota bacterium]
MEAGATPDGTADWTAAFQKLLDQAGAAGGGAVAVPAGRYRISGHLVIPANVTLPGVYRVPPTTEGIGVCFFDVAEVWLARRRDARRNATGETRQSCPLRSACSAFGG